MCLHPWVVPRDVAGRPSALAVWGPSAWSWLHCDAITYPERPTRAQANAKYLDITQFIRSLPCIECIGHATAYIRENPPDLASSWAYQVWAWKFHNAVNARKGLSLFSFDSYMKLYNLHRHA